MFGYSVNNALPVFWNAAIGLAQSLLGIALIFLAGYIGVRFLRIAMDRLEALLIRTGEKTEEIPGAARKRVTTLTGVLGTIGVGIIWAVVIVVALDQLAQVGVGPGF